MLKKDGKPTSKAVQRKCLLESIDPVSPHKLKYEPEIGKLRKELATLLRVEANAKGRLLTVKETQTLSRKDEILDEIEELEFASRGWFEDDGTFKLRVEASRSKFESKRFGNSKKGEKRVVPVGADTKASAPVNRWVVPGAGKAKANN
eukprot:3637589-Ditylum_brightwellii.AAC.1